MPDKWGNTSAFGKKRPLSLECRRLPRSSHVPFGHSDPSENYDVNQLHRPSQIASAATAPPLQFRCLSPLQNGFHAARISISSAGGRAGGSL